MAKFVKSILLLLFAVALYGVANNSFTEKSVEDVSLIALAPEHQDSVSTPQLPCWPVTAFTSELQTHRVATDRVQRVQLGEYFSSLRNMLQDLAERDASLSRHQGRIYATTTSCYCHPSSEYYVFTLRRIII